MTNSEIKFLEGPQSKWEEFKFSVKVLLEFIKGFRALHFVGPCVTIFGSARFKEDHPYYIKAREFGKRIAGLGFTTMTGGGPGIMEAANRGAFENGGNSVGCNIQLPFEQQANPYTQTSVTFEHFFVRKVLLVRYPHPEAWSLAFQTAIPGEVTQQLNEDYVGVFIPTAPSPVNGFYFYVRRADTIEINMSVDVALKSIISMGVVASPAMAKPSKLI